MQWEFDMDSELKKNITKSQEFLKVKEYLVMIIKDFEVDENFII